MNRLQAIYPQAIEHTKHKVLEDMDFYLAEQEKLPSFEEYLIARRNYNDQIWVNVWLNKATNEVPVNEKKAFLVDKGFDVEGVARKLINHLFRTEMRTYEPFDVHAWLKQAFGGNEQEWAERYEQAKLDFLEREQEHLYEENKKRVQKDIDNAVQDVIREDYELLYLRVRHLVANQIASDMVSKTRYKRIDTYALEEKLTVEGSFAPEDYKTVPDFFEELTGEIHKTLHWGRTYFEYETYYYAYQRLIEDYLADYVPKRVIEKLDPKLVKEYEEFNEEELSTSYVRRIIDNTLDAINHYFIEKIQQEYVVDLIALANQSFDADVHKEIYEKDLAERERKKAEELAEIKRKKEEEARMLNDIFGREYSPSVGRKIRYVLHIGETNTGKTHHALERMKEAKSGLYLAPLRLLALEVYDKLNADGVPCSLKTGEEEKLQPNAQHISCTVEMFHEKEPFDIVVIDEAQMITDKDRGFSWYKAITKANAKEVHIIGSRNAKNMMLQLLGDSDIEINEYSRDTPLEVETKEFKMNHVKKGDALICFSRRRVLETASRLQNAGHSVSMIYGSMPPETRKKQIERFNKGEATIIVATDAIGMGLNLPIRRIVFLENDKFDGTRRRYLTSQEVKQIAGRAGRKGIYNVGKVAFTAEIKKMKQLLIKEDEPVHTFAIAPTNTVFERFQRYSRNLGDFFELWDQFKSPKGTKKAALSEERELYRIVKDTDIEARLPLMDLYGYLHLPFASKEPMLVRQWYETMEAIIENRELPEPILKSGSLEDSELAYKAVGLHLLFLYRLERRTEAVYWERIREEISDQVHERLKTDVRKMTKKCRNCGKKLPWDHSFQICDACHSAKYRKKRRVWYGEE